MEDQFVYLWKIVEAVAYKNGVDRAIKVEYRLPYCKNVEKCKECMRKACNVFGDMFGIKVG